MEREAGAMEGLAGLRKVWQELIWLKQ